MLCEKLYTDIHTHTNSDEFVNCVCGILCEHFTHTYTYTYTCTHKSGCDMCLWIACVASYVKHVYTHTHIHMHKHTDRDVVGVCGLCVWYSV